MITRIARGLRAAAAGPLAAADAFCNRLYGWRYNPLYQSGTLVVVAFGVMLLTGLYLLLFYRIGGPYESIQRIDQQVWAGRWMRALHRYAADVAVAAALLHALRMFVQGRTWGARTLAWLSGLVLLFLTFVSGWTGYVMLWDAQAQLLALEGARLMDALPIFSEPISRTFVGERPIPSAFFFLNLFAHIAFPIGMALLLWIHVSRLSRPVLLPPRGLLWGSVLLMFAASLTGPAPLGPKADLYALLGEVELDAFYSFWLPLSRLFAPVEVWLTLVAVTAALGLVPFWTRPASPPQASVSDERLCTGCDQCSLDCPYEAIEMVPPASGHVERVSRVDESLCVSCGICSGSCAPMVIGPPARSGRDALADVKAFAAERRPGARDVVVVACERGAGGAARERSLDGAAVHPVSCAGNLHTSVVEYLVRSGVGGVLIVSCPPRDCANREGPQWLEQRLYHDREAELHERVDRRRLRLVWAGGGERGVVRRALAELRLRIAELDAAAGESEIALETECDAPSEAGP